jgi:hypothetical protein
MSSRHGLSRAALAFRLVHAAITAGFLLAIAYVWWCALSGRRGALLRIAVTALIGEGVLVIANRGDCPLGGLQERLGDPVPLFELALSPKAARRAVPVLGVITAAGVALLAKGTDDLPGLEPNRAPGAQPGRPAEFPCSPRVGCRWQALTGSKPRFPPDERILSDVPNPAPAESA